jgi:serine/threonine protein kinase/tetratricopeptide (TPR) repeat protein
MTPERWHEVETLFHSALDVPAERRRAFLQQATTGDEELAREVESLLAALVKDGGWNEDAAPALAAEMLDDLRQKLPDGSTLAQYRILDRLGSGGMGEVYKAMDTRLQRVVALKVLAGTGFEDKTMKRALAEARAASSLNHPNIATVYEMGQVDGFSFIAMEYVEGETLAARLRRGAMPVGESREIGRQIAEALGEAHARGVVHRDIKPANIALTAKGTAKILDFGVAKLVSAHAETTHANTLPGLVVGTLQYMSPEQLRGEAVDGRSDLFSLGAVLYEMTAGRGPFDADSPTAVMAKILHEPPAPKPGPLEGVILRCLEKDRSRRFQTAGDVAGALSQETFRPPRRALVWIAGAMAAVGLVVAGWTFIKTGAPVSTPIRSIAVLPLANNIGSKDAQYLPDGITDALIADLAATKDLRTISRTTTWKYKNSPTGATDAARDLGVDGVVTGSVSRSGSRVQVRADLFRTPGNRRVWSRQFDRDVTELPELERELSRDLLREIGANTPPAPAQPGAATAVSPAAYESYLRGRYQMSMLTPPTLDDAVRLFRQSASAAPDFPQAYSGMADAFNLMTPYANLPPDEVYPKAKAAAVKALELNDRLGEAHASLAVVEDEYDWNHASAEQHFRRAIDLTPGYGSAHQWYGEFLVRLRRYEEGISELRKARDLDPLSLPVNASLGYALAAAGRNEEASAQLRTAIDLDPKFALAQSYLGWSLLRTGKYEEAAGAYRTALSLADGNPRYRTGLAVALAMAGKRKEALGALAELNAASKRSFVPASYRCLIYAALNDRPAALAWLDKASHERGVASLNLNNEPVLYPLRDDPAFALAQRRMGF